jgi:hypothetical protein
MSKLPFKSDLVLEEVIGDSTLRAYSAGFDQNEFRLKPLVDVIAEVIPEFALGYHSGSSIPIPEVRSKLKEAATRVYTTENYKKRGEFGELILHLLLRDYFGSIPLVSKIWFKDTDNAVVHGFDGVHVVNNDAENQLWLGESKLYADGKAGVKELAKDLVKHLENDYLRREFSLIATKLPEQDPDIEYWRGVLHEHARLEDILDKVVIPMVCTYSSDLYKSHSNNNQEFLDDFRAECVELHQTFLGKKIDTEVDVILLLLPVPSKPELTEELDKRLKSMQSI